MTGFLTNHERGANRKYDQRESRRILTSAIKDKLNRLPLTLYTMSSRSQQPAKTDEEMLMQSDDEYPPSKQPESKINQLVQPEVRRHKSEEDQQNIRLTPTNWAIVRRLTNRVRETIASRERTKHLLSRTELQITQSIRPVWLRCRTNPPLLPGAVAFPAEFHTTWESCANKYEKRLLKKIVKYLPDVITSLETRLTEQRITATDTIAREIDDQQQKERAQHLFSKFANQAERESPLLRQGTSTYRPPHRPRGDFNRR